MTRDQLAALAAADDQLAAIVKSAHAADSLLTPIARQLGVKCADVLLLARFASLIRREVARQLRSESRELFGARP